jgi:nanoRNase/pAp phosphatase (c-di-AMP/oligoRNAs hydrolase)
MNENTKVQFDEFVAKYDRFAVFVHNFPDPDAIGSALGIKRVLQSIKSAQVRIYGRGISHPQNKTMVNSLNITLHDPDDFKRECSPDTSIPCNIGVVFVDFNGRNNNFVGDIHPEWVIDHHIDKKAVENEPGLDLRPYGACASIICDYLQTYSVDLKQDDPPDAGIATALMLGIMTDTKNMVSEQVTENDWEAFRYLHSKCDREKLNHIINYELPDAFYDLMHKAGEKHITVGSLVVINLGFLSESNRDAIPYIADLWERHKGKDTVLVFGVIDKSISASARVKKGAIKANDLVRGVFGDGGGHSEKAGAKIDLGWIDPKALKDTRDKLLDVFSELVLKKACQLTDTSVNDA